MISYEEQKSTIMYSPQTVSTTSQSEFYHQISCRVLGFLSIHGVFYPLYTMQILRLPTMD